MTESSPSTPVPPGEAARAAPAVARPLALVGAAATTVFAGAVVGATTNAVNGAVSPTYFVHVLRWHGVSDVWRASVAQGVFEGVLFGVLFAIIFTLTVGIVTRAACPYRVALRSLLGIIAATYACWAAGGAVAMGLATLSPEFFRRAFIGVPAEFGPMLRYAWVGGSIWGAQLGGLLSLVIGLVVFRAKWKGRGPDAHVA